MEDERQRKGKQKIEMKLIKNIDDRITTFSKRRSGIFKKTNELATLCGAEVGFGTYSPKGKPYSFAQPSMDSIENHLIAMENSPLISDSNTTLMWAQQEVNLEGLNQQYDELVSSVEAEKEKRKALEKLMEKSAGKNASGKGWWETLVDELGYEELVQMNESLEELQKKLHNHMNIGDGTANNAALGTAPGNSGENPN